MFSLRRSVLDPNVQICSFSFQTCHEEQPSEAITLPRVSNGLEKDIGTMTEPESLGPCEPGTAVKLQGIVWQETDKG